MSWDNKALLNGTADHAFDNVEAVDRVLTWCLYITLSYEIMTHSNGQGSTANLNVFHGITGGQ